MACLSKFFKTLLLNWEISTSFSPDSSLLNASSGWFLSTKGWDKNGRQRSNTSITEKTDAPVIYLVYERFCTDFLLTAEFLYFKWFEICSLKKLEMSLFKIVGEFRTQYHYRKKRVSTASAAKNSLIFP